jgi:exodeoxyribonuclease V alpha subunit
MHSAKRRAQGHCGLPYTELVPLAVKLLDIPEIRHRNGDRSGNRRAKCLFPDTVDCQPCVFMASLYFAEQSIAAQIRRLKTSATTLPTFDADKAIPWVEEKLSIQLADSQKESDSSRADLQAVGDYRWTLVLAKPPWSIPS